MPALAVELLEQQRVVGGVDHHRHVRGSSWPPRAASWGRRCRCSRSPRRRARPSPPCPRRGRGSRPPRRSAAMPCSSSACRCSGTSAPRQDAAVDLRVQRLHAAVEDLREAGGLRDAGHRDARLLAAPRRCRRWRRSRSRASTRPRRELDDAVLAVHGEQRAAVRAGSSGLGRVGARPALGGARGAQLRLAHAGDVAARLAPDREPGGGDGGHRARVGERGHAEDGRAVVERAVVDDAAVRWNSSVRITGAWSRLRSTSDLPVAPAAACALELRAPAGRRARPGSWRGSRRRSA